MKKILFNSEASFILSGFGKYYRELIPRLYNTGKYDIAEFASYGKVFDEKRNMPWKYYANAVPEDDPRFKEYSSSQSNAFGQWRFERVLLDFKPDIVIDLRDPWMLLHAFKSPLRKYFHYIVCPTCDSEPQRNEWIDYFISADAVFGYTNWGLEVMKRQSGNKINAIDVAYPGVDSEIYKPVDDKRQHRKNMGFDEDAFIVGFVARNQKRKLFPDLFKSFRKFLNESNPDIEKRSYLYIHTSYPDVGWDIPSLINEYNLYGKVICTYICKETKKPFISFFNGARVFSPHSNSPTGVLPSVGLGVTEEQLADIYNVFDLYVQVAICEGLGMSQLEAASCGIPIASVDYSAMSEVVELTKGLKIKVKNKFREMETGADRVYPDIDSIVEVIRRFARMDKSYYEKYSKNSRKAALNYFSWDKTAKVYENYIDSIQELKNWNYPPDLREVPENFPKNLSNRQFVDFLYDMVGESEKRDSYQALMMIRDLNYGSTQVGMNMKKFGREDLFRNFKQYLSNKNHVEQCRCGTLKMSEEDYITYKQI